MSSQRIRIAIADDQPLFRRGVADALRQHPCVDVIAETTSGRPALEAILGLEPDVAIIDGSPGHAGRTHLLREVARRGALTKILVLTPGGDPGAAESALASGVGGYLTRDTDGDELCGAAIVVARGGTVISDQVKGDLAVALEQGEAGARNPLSNQEQEVLVRIAQGRSARAIGQELHRSEATIKSYLRRIYDKLGVGTQAAAVAEGMHRELITYRPENTRAQIEPASVLQAIA